MGTHCSSELHRGHIQVKKTTTMKLILLTALAAVAMAEPEADAHYGYYGYGYHPGFYGYGLWGHQQAWPTASAPGVSSTCFGCRGKRSAEADAEAEPGYGFYGYYPYGYYGLHRGYYGLPLGAGVAGHPVAAVAPVHAFYGYGLPAVYNNPHLQWPGVKTPFFERTTWGLRGKRSAEADAEPGYYGYPYGYYGYPYYGYRTGNYVHRSPQGLGK